MNKIIKREGVLPKDFSQAFKPADIRGIYEKEINEEVVYRIGRAFVKFYKLKKVVIGRDMRISSPSLHSSLTKGIMDEGADVIDLGLLDTPGVYFASGSLNLFGAMITASHNPPQFNGIKLLKKGAVPLTNKDGLNEIKKLVIQNNFSKKKKKGKLIKKAILHDYKKYLRSLVRIDSPRDIKLVIDAGNGMASELANLVCTKYPLKITPMYFKLDGRFPNRGSNPTLAKNNINVRKKIKKVHADFGVAFDGDADRVAFFDEKGRTINSSVVGSLLAKHILKQNNNKGNIVYTVFTSKSFYEAIKKYGGKPILAKVGHSFIKNKMRKTDSLFSCEHSAHFYYKKNYFTDSAIITFLYILDLYSKAVKKGKTMSELIREFDHYYQTEEVLIKVFDKKKILKKIKEHYTKKNPVKMHQKDGLYIEFNNYWFDLKKSVTEDALKIVLEAKNKKTMKEKQKEILNLIKTYNQKETTKILKKN